MSREQDDQRRRQQELSALAQRAAREAPQAAPRPVPRRHGSRPALRTIMPWRDRRRKLRVALLCSLAALLVAGTSIAAYTLVSSEHAHPLQQKSARLFVSATLAQTLDLPTLAHLHCPDDVAWSPDGTRIAVVGLTTVCVNSPQAPQFMVAILDVTTGTLVRTSVLDPFLTERHISARPLGLVSWSPDGHTLAIPLQQFVAGTSGAAWQVRQGVLLLPTASGSDAGVQVLLGPPQNLLDSAIWDVGTGQLIHRLSGDLPPASAYTWTSDGQLLPSSSAAGSPSATVPLIVGWQAGNMLPINAPGAISVSRSNPPGGWYFHARPTLWSPDGRYVAPQVPLDTLLTSLPQAAPTPTPTVSAGGSSGNGATCDGPALADVCAQSPAPAPDRAFALLLKAAEAGTAPAVGMIEESWPAVSIDWSPQRNLVATIPPVDTVGQDANLQITLLSTQTGQVVAKLRAPNVPQRNLFEAGLNQGRYGTPLTHWAPTGHLLAFADWLGSQVVLWTVTSSVT